jgi:hypothetical protein
MSKTLLNGFLLSSSGNPKSNQRQLKFGNEEEIGKTMSPAKTQRREVQGIRKEFLTLRLSALAG